MHSRKAQSVRHFARPSLAIGADDLGVLREGDESNEDVLRRQLLNKDKECDELKMKIQILQDQLSQRYTPEQVEDIKKDHQSLELLLQGTQRENERCMAEIERGKMREKMLERELAKLAGENWQSALDIAPVPATIGRTGLHQRSNTIASPLSTSSRSSPTRSMTAPITTESPTSISPPDSEQERQRLAAHIEQVRMLVLGVEQRLQGREEKLISRIEKAEGETKRFEEIRKQITADA
ncbi:hypothetical protein WG66_014698 [Moniliophthora roreri]|uniref:Uncharacterized protein n=1 Tax=Moniliophthora roreri TaxID=221103 RepID=A0A0W0ETH3_MONRR|nr:hypothetical protein WG66_014698 [Moniliophthora roreri]